SLRISHEHGDTGNLALAYSNLAMNYKTLEVLDSARLYADSALMMAEKINDVYTKAHATGIIGLVEFGSGHYETALPYLRQSYDLFKKRGNKAEAAEISNALGKVHFSRHNIDSSLYYYLNAKNLAEESGWNSYIRSSYEGLSDCYSAKGDFRNAY